MFYRQDVVLDNRENQYQRFALNEACLTTIKSTILSLNRKLCQDGSHARERVM